MEEKLRKKKDTEEATKEVSTTTTAEKVIVQGVVADVSDAPLCKVEINPRIAASNEEVAKLLEVSRVLGTQNLKVQVVLYLPNRP